ncbi:MAG: pitrilysin family protein [Acidobacteriota bacterium]
MSRLSSRLLAAVVAIAAVLAISAPALGAPGIPRMRVLPNGLKVVTLEDHTMPLVAASLWIGAGSKYEIETSAGYAHFLEHLIQRGTPTSGAFEYGKRANRWGGGITVRADYDRTHITGTAVAASAGELIDAVADMALRATLEDAQIDAELRVFSREMRTHYDNPWSVAFLETMRATFTDHPYRVPPLGNFRTVGRLKSPPLTAFYRNLYVPNNMALAVAGDFDPDVINDHIDAAFAGARASSTLPPPPSPPATFPGHDDVEKRLAVRDSWTTLSFLGPGYRHPDRLAIDVLTRALADPGLVPMRQALLHSRTGQGAQVSYYGLEDAGLLYIATQPVNPLRSYGAAAALLEKIAEFKERGLREEEMAALVMQIVSEERIRAERISVRAERLGESALFGGMRYYWDLPKGYDELTVADVTRVMDKYLVADNMRLMIMVPEATSPFQEKEKNRFHEALERLGRGRPGAVPGLAARRYSDKQADRVTSDAWGEWRGAIRLPAPSRTRLDNGLTVIIQEDRRHSLVAATLHLDIGSRHDPSDRAGLAFLAGRILAASPGPARIAEPVSDESPEESQEPDGKTESPPLLGRAPYDVRVGRDFTEIRLLTIPERLPSSLGALGTALRHPDTNPAIFAHARNAALSIVDRGTHDPATIALDLFHEKVYAGHPYAHAIPGTHPGLSGLTGEEVTRFLEQRLRPDTAVLVLTGAIRQQEAIQLATDLFGEWSSGKRMKDDGTESKNVEEKFTHRAGEFERLLDTSRSQVLVGVPAAAIGDPDFSVIRQIGTALTVFGFEEMVFERRAAFALSAIPEGLSRSGALSITIQTPHIRRDEAVFDMQRLMRRLALTPLSAEDLADIARAQAGREAASLQGVMALASHLGFREMAGLDGTKYREDLGSSPIGTPEQLRDAAKRYLKPGNWIIIKVGPSS